MKHIHQNQEFRFNEVLFEHRNKEYGAYALRNESDRILTKALFVGVSLLAAISITPIVINAFKTPAVSDTGGYVLPPPVYIVETEDPPADVLPPKATPPPSVKQFDNTVPTPTKNAVEPKKEEIPDDAVAGFKNDFKAEPAKPNTYTPPAPVIGTGTIPSVKPQLIVPEKDPNEIVGADGLSVEANFAGGIESFRNKVINNFDGSGFESDDLMRTTVTFIVEIDGTISNIKANGTNVDFNSEAMRTVRAISAKGKWTPGKNKKGESVRSYFKFPISMKLE
ncbi:hypothetical protein QFZ37_001722 [Chryseobacterium ginsenosidimutans]|uniref:energy transducer TonB n=1 Tax=Chryseobacterium ginsenosidimutans TaxID=687846 RepID=UPI002787D929|nr:energy transducer TonB [Chryseobacterium ginsenosidimutans]MDQ0593353.1 hypothetical protein [Chryseobacterium ginsenosidimutans]